MWHETTKYKKKTENYNETFKKLQGELEDKEAKITLCKFLRQNLYFTTYLLTGIKLAPYQEITLKGMFNRNFNMCVWGRGCSKSFIASVYCVLQCVFEPNTKILIAGPTFRTARAIFNNIEKILLPSDNKIISTTNKNLLNNSFLINKEFLKQSFENMLVFFKEQMIVLNKQFY